MAKEKREKKPKRNWLAVKIASVVLVVLVLSFVGAFAAYSQDYKNKILPNISILGTSLSGKSKEEAKQIISKLSEEKSGQNIKMVSGDKNWEMKYSDLNWSLKIDEITNDAYSLGHSGNKLTDMMALSYVTFKTVALEPKFSFNENQATDWILTINAEIGTPKTEANVQVKNKKAKIIDPTPGKELELSTVKNEVYQRLALKKQGDISLQLVESQPVIAKEEAEGLADKAIALVNREAVLVGPKGETTWSSNTLGGLVQIKKDEKKSGFLQRSTYGDPYVSFNEGKISSLLEDLSETMNAEPVEAKFTITDGAVSIQSPSQDGTIIDITPASKTIVAALQNGTEGKIKLDSKAQKASIQAKDPADIAKFGIKELIGSGTTTFTGSSSNRVHNIKTGIKAISGALLKPGEEFSTTGQLGEIDASTGYLEEMVIKEDKTVPEFGGGLCQVATTLFRSALNSGLKITERHNHSYRVGYYEPPVGMDATIYSPSPDFKFVNDTDSYVLIQGRVEGYTATFDFYGTKDGRTIEISQPVVYDEVSPPETIYIDDPSLAPGEEKRIDRAHPGAKASFTYKVTKNGQVLSDKKFNSSYVPWPAKYLRGPAQEGSDQPAQ